MVRLALLPTNPINDCKGPRPWRGSRGSAPGGVSGRSPDAFPMTEPRVKAGLWVSMALRMGDSDGRPGVVLRKGDPDAGACWWCCTATKGLTCCRRFATPRSEVAWMRGTGAAPVDQATADAYIARQVKFDPDLWVLEFEAPDLLPPFEAKIV